MVNVCIFDHEIQMTSRTDIKTLTLFLGDLRIGGAERVFVTLAQQLSLRGYSVRLLLAHKAGSLLNDIPPHIPVIDLGAYRKGNSGLLFGLRTLYSLIKYLRLNQVGVLISTLTGANILALAARELSGGHAPVIIREASTLSNVNSSLRLLAMKCLYPKADRVVALTSSMKNDLENFLKMNNNKISVIGNPIDIDKIKMLSKSESDSQEISQLKPYVLSIGRLSEPKDFKTLILAIKEIPDYPRLVIIGDGPDRSTLENLIQTHKLENRVYLAGFRSNPYPWLSNAEAFVLSSHWEGYPNVLLEAAAFNLPTITTQFDKISAAEIAQSIGAIVVPTESPSALSNAIVHVLTSKQENRVLPPLPSLKECIDEYEQLIAHISTTASSV